MSFHLVFPMIYFLFSTLKQVAVGKDPLSECQLHHSYAQDQFINIIPVFLTCICCYLYILRKKIFFNITIFLVIKYT